MGAEGETRLEGVYRDLGGGSVGMTAAECGGGGEEQREQVRDVRGAVGPRGYRERGGCREWGGAGDLWGL